MPEFTDPTKPLREDGRLHILIIQGNRSCTMGPFLPLTCFDQGAGTLADQIFQLVSPARETKNE